jgi:hypothetical protein
MVGLQEQVELWLRFWVMEIVETKGKESRQGEKTPEPATET